MKFNAHKGFTLIEVMIVVVIIATLAVIAFANYSSYITQTRCTEGRTALLIGAAALDKCKFLYGKYDDGNCNTANFTGDTPDGHFSVTLVKAATSFTLTATGQAAAAAANNTFCPTITLNHLGVQGGTGSSPW